MMRKILFVVFLATTSSWPGLVLAEVNTSASPTGTTEQAAQATDIIVTAQRRPERLQNVPISVTAVSGDTLKTRGLNDLAQVSLAAPSLQIGSDNNFAVRGVGTQTFSSSIESSVAFAQDEVNLTNPGLVSDLFDVAQVEVLNGPQGLLFGRNASAGLLNVTTTRPILEKYGANFDLEGDYRDTAPGRSGGSIARASLNIPVGNTLAVRLSGFYDYQDPIVKFVGPSDGRNDLELRRYGARAKLLWQPNDRLSIYIIGDYGEEHGVLGQFDTTYRGLGAMSVDAAPLASTGITPGPDNTTTAGDAGYYRDLKRRGVQGKISYNFENGIEVSDIAAWKSFDRVAQVDEDGTAEDGANINYDNTSFDQYSNELRLALPSENRLSGQGGLYYFHSHLNEISQVAGNNFVPSFALPSFPSCVGATAVAGAFPPTCSTSNGYFLGNDHVVHQNSDSYAAFGQLTYRLFDGLQLIAGGRVTHDHINIDLVQNQDPYFVTLGIPFSGSDSYRHTAYSYKGGGQYNISRDIMVYATYARGYKGPGFNNNAVSSDPNSLVVRPETNNNIELGAKTSWLNRKLVANISLFQSHFSDYQVQSFDLTTSSFITQNAAKLHTKGIEGTIIIRPARGLTLNASATLLDSKFGDFPGAQCYPSQGCNVFNAKGQRPPFAPKFTTSVEGTYEFHTNGSTTPFVEANYYHRARIAYTVQPAPGTSYGKTNILGGSVGVRGPNWRASIFCKNCTDQRVPVAIALEPGDSFAGITSYTQHFGLDSFRTIGVQLGFNF